MRYDTILKKLEIFMRLTFTEKEYNLLQKILTKHQETEYSILLHRKFKKSFPTSEGLRNKQNGAIKARKKVEYKNNKKIDIAIHELIRKKEKISVTSISKEACISYNTAKKYKIRIDFAEADRLKTL